MDAKKSTLIIIRKELHKAEDALHTFKKSFRGYEDDEIEMNKLYTIDKTREYVLNSAKDRVIELESCITWLKSRQ